MRYYNCGVGTQRFRYHLWSVWTQESEGKILKYQKNTGTREEVGTFWIQKRECTRCHLVDRRRQELTT